MPTVIIKKITNTEIFSKPTFTGKAFLDLVYLGLVGTPLIFSKSKIVTDIKFPKSNKITKGSPDWLTRESRRLIKRGHSYRV